MADLSGQTLKGYRIDKQLGAGGFGAVYSAYQPIIERDVAIKVILAEYANQPDFIRRFESEAHLIARLEHPSIVPLYDYWREPDGAFLVLRWLRGGSLTQHLKQGAFEPEAAAKLLDQVGAALAFAHRNNVVHRDIKPDNILLDDDGNAYLTDFGISTIIGHTPDGDEEGVSGTIRYIAPEQLRQEPDAITIDIYSLGIVMFEVLTGSHPFEEHTNAEILMKHLSEPLPPLHDIRPDLPETLDAVIQKATEKDPADRYQTTIEMAQAFNNALSSPIDLGEWHIDTSNLMNPFKGLRAFQEADAGDFFGRKDLTARLISLLEQSRFIAVIGPGGSGKSSVVRAGVLPALRENAIAGSADWFITDMIPGANPFDELEAALLSVTANMGIPFGQLLKQEAGIAESIKYALPTPDSELVIVIDQFEELFTMVEDETERSRFLNGLLHAVNDPECNLRLIITLRADFYDRPLLYPEFGELVRTNMETVMPLTRAELEEVITYPIVQSGALLESGLNEMILNDVEQRPGALPLLQYALTELFERHENGMLTINSYQEIGGVAGALAQRAEQVYANLDPTLKAVSRQLFLRLVTPGDNDNDTRRRVTRDELTALDASALNTVLDTFGKVRLLTFDRDPITRTPTVEIAHEALIRRWGQFQHWIEDSREDIRLHRRLVTEVQEWLEADRDGGFLLTDSRLEQYDSWSKSTDLALNDNEQAFIDASIERREYERQRDEARKARELELQQNANRRLKYLVGSLSVFLVVAVLLSGFALNQRDVAETASATSEANAIIAEGARNLAERRADEANSLALASQSMLELNQYNTDLAISLGLVANSIENPPAVSQNALRNAAYSPATRTRCDTGMTQTVTYKLSHDGAKLLTSNWDQTQAETTFTLWDTATCDMLKQTTFPDKAVTAIDFIGEGDTVLMTTLDTRFRQTATVMLWDIDAWEAIYEEQGIGYSFHINISPDGSTALIDYVQRGVVLWDIAEGTQISAVPGSYYISRFLQDNQRALSANQTSAVLWDTTTGEELLEFETPPDTLTALSISPDERYAVGSTEFAVLIAWDMESGEIIREYYGHSEEVYDIVFLPDGNQFLSASQDASIRLWDFETAVEVYRFPGHRDAIRDISLSPDGRHFVSWSVDGTARTWDIFNPAELRQFSGHEEGINAVAVDPEMTYLASGDIGNGLYLWDIETGDRLREFSGAQFIHRITFSPDGQFILTSALNGLYLHNVETGELEWRRGEIGFTDANYSPDGSKIVGTVFTQSAGGIWIIDAETGNVLNRYDNASPVLSGVFVDENRLIFSAGSTACLWDYSAQTEPACFEGHTADIWSVRVNEDRTRLATASYDGSVRLWDVESGEQIRSLDGHSAPVLSAVFSEDDRYVLTAGTDNTMRLWDAETGFEVRRYLLPSAVWSAILVPEIDQAVTGSEDGIMRLWDVSVTDIDTLINWVHDNRYVVEATCEQLALYGAESLCEEESS